jgi:hypothetical protein
MEFLTNIYEQTNPVLLVAFAAVILLLWFLPAILALFFNPKHVKYIAIACIPAGFSFIAWGALLVWATTGKVIEKFQAKVPATD